MTFTDVAAHRSADCLDAQSASSAMSSNWKSLRFDETLPQVACMQVPSMHVLSSARQRVWLSSGYIRRSCHASFMAFTRIHRSIANRSSFDVENWLEGHDVLPDDSLSDSYHEMHVLEAVLMIHDDPWPAP
jgi:hypothetical protein